MRIHKQFAALLPARAQTELKRLHFGRQIRSNRFVTPEPEFGLLDTLAGPGDWVLDIGANIGHYTKRLSDLVGANGRVIAFEPVPTTFSLLAANVELFEFKNVSLVNAAASGQTAVLGMSMPRFDTGLSNYYEAHIDAGSAAGLRVLTLSVDSLGIDTPVRLVKIDAEGHEALVLEGMQALIGRFKPHLILETSSDDVVQRLVAQGYTAQRLPGSPNVLLKARAASRSLSPVTAPSLPGRRG